MNVLEAFGPCLTSVSFHDAPLQSTFKKWHCHHARHSLPIWTFHPSKPPWVEVCWTWRHLTINWPGIVSRFVFFTALLNQFLPIIWYTRLFDWWLFGINHFSIEPISSSPDDVQTDGSSSEFSRRFLLDGQAPQLLSPVLHRPESPRPLPRRRSSNQKQSRGEEVHCLIEIVFLKNPLWSNINLQLTYCCTWSLSMCNLEYLSYSIFLCFFIWRPFVAWDIYGNFYIIVLSPFVAVL